MCTPLPCSYRPSSLTLGAVVDAYGSPDRIAAYGVNLSETYLFAVTLFYPSKGMTINASTNGPTRSEVRRDFEVVGVSYWQSRSLSEMTEEFSRTGGPWSFTLEHSQPWSGFGPVQTVPPP